jgi:hypothetical protein
LVTDQIANSFQELESDKVLGGEGPATKEEFQRRLASFERAMLTPTSLFAEAAYWDCQNKGFILGFEKYLALPSREGGGYSRHLDLRKYPVVVCWYVAGTLGFLSQHLDLFAKLTDLIAAQAFKGVSPSGLLWASSPFSELSSSSPNVFCDWLGVTPSYLAQSAYIFKYLEPILGEVTPSDEASILAFDRFEYLVSFIHADFRIVYERTTGHQILLFTPPGLFAYRYRFDAPRRQSCTKPSGVFYAIFHQSKACVLLCPLDQGARLGPVSA